MKSSAAIYFWFGQLTVGLSLRTRHTSRRTVARIATAASTGDLKCTARPHAFHGACRPVDTPVHAIASSRRRVNEPFRSVRSQVFNNRARPFAHKSSSSQICSRFETRLQLRNSFGNGFFFKSAARSRAFLVLTTNVTSPTRRPLFSSSSEARQPREFLRVRDPRALLRVHLRDLVRRRRTRGGRAVRGDADWKV
eukprot:31505-Pelagococcus_subviridis.AAC.6